ncbi:hypothetical protein [Aciduliprofundum sp. MAR08-339]|uniref:hypothetical protein n=1 Tax=Aciduliprofundum sp. (strain MAR08-339) TaxID=673860 RepID=UPI00064EEDB5
MKLIESHGRYNGETLKEKRKRRRFLLRFFTIGALFLCLSPWVSLIIGLLLAGSATFGMSPYRNAYQGFRSSALLGGFASKTAMRMSSLAASLISMALGWKGLVVSYF